MMATEFCSKLVVVIGRKYIRMDGFPSDSPNSKRLINTSKLTKDILEAKNFNSFPEDLQPTLDTNPNSSAWAVTLNVEYEMQPVNHP